MASFERILKEDTGKHLSKMETMAGKEELRVRKVRDFKRGVEDLTDKWNKNKSEFKSNADVKKGIVGPLESA